jgi:hypothetical protein
VTLEKWLRRRSKIFFTSGKLMSHRGLKQAVDFSAGKAKNI